MAEFVSTKRALAAIEAVIDEAQMWLTIVSPYQRLTENFKSRIKAASNRGVPIIILYGKSEMSGSQRKELEQLRGVTLAYSAGLHAKCYFNEKTMVITSLNLLQSSEQNWEMGIRLSSSEEAFLEACREVDLILTGARVIRHGSPANERAPARETGNCIRCRATLPLDPLRPFCLSCFRVWADWNNWDYPERYCHACGQDAPTSRAEVMCPSCAPAYSRGNRAFA